MSWLKEQLYRMKHLLSKRRRFDDDLREEMRLHLDLRTEENPDAAREARVRFGNVGRIQEESRAAWGWPALESMFHDVRYGIRTLAASPAFTITAIVSLTLGIGANAAIFSLLNAIMVRTLPVKDPSQLVAVNHTMGPSFTNPMWEQVRDHSGMFDGAFAYGDSQFDLSNGGVRQFATGLMVSGDYFRTLGVPAIRGRVITAEDDRHGCGPNGPVAVISHRFWQSQFDGDPSIVGRTISLDRVNFQIVGVTPAWFTGLDKDMQYEAAVPIGCEPLFHTDSSALDKRSWWWLRVVARLKPGATLRTSQAQIAALAPEIMRATVPKWDAEGQKEYLSRTFTLEPASTGFSGLGRTYGQALITLQVVVALVLLIACANVANLLLARSTARQRELSVRLAIGAGRGRIVRQLLTESLLLAAGGAMAGLSLAVWGTKLLVHMLNSSGAGSSRAKPFDFELDTSLDLTVLGFTALIVVLTTLFFGLLPALRASCIAPNAVLKEHGHGSVTGGSGRFTLANIMVAIQIGLALTLLSAAALFGESFRRILSVDSGFDVRNVVLVPVEVPQALLQKSQRIQAFDQALERLRQIPGVRSASRSDLTPLSNMTWNDELYADGYQLKSSKDERLVNLNSLSPGYFESMGAKLIAGRDFDVRDSLGAPRVMIIGETTARTFWGRENPLGRIIRKDSPDNNGTKDSYQIVGVVNDMKYESLSETPQKTAFVPVMQEPNPGNNTVFELRLDSEDSLNRVLPLVRNALIETNRNFSLRFQRFDSQVSDSLIRPRLIATVSGFFGAIALILAATGLYGVIAYSTARRKAEIGLRMALGASTRNVVWFVLRDTTLTLAAGSALGLTAAYFAGSFVESLVFGVRPADPSVLGVALAVLIATAAIAAYIPAQRAARLDPMDSLRIE